MTHEEFVEKIKCLFPDENYNFLSKYKNAHHKIIISNKYGICKITPWSLLSGNKLSIRSAIDKKSYFINQFKEKFGDKYSFDKFEYFSSSVNSTVTCKTHGYFKMSPNNLLSGYGCKKCANDVISDKLRMTNKYFEEKAQYKHGTYYDYSEVILTTNKNKVIIKCPTHGRFYQTVSDHLSGCGCPKCGNERISHARRKIPSEFSHFVQKTRGCIATSFRRKGYKKNSKTFSLLGIDWEGFKSHLEDNPYGFKVTDENIELDHIIPISTARSEKDVIELNHYLNFQLLPGQYNKYVKRHKGFDRSHFEKWLIEKWGERETR